MTTTQQLYEEYGKYTYYLCLKLTRNKEEAEDLMQDVWVKVVRYEGKLQTVEKMKAWLTTITMNTFRDRYRKNVRQSQYMMNQPQSLDVPILDLVASEELTPGETIEQEDMQSIVQRKINELDDIYAQTIELFYVYQYSLIEIAEEMKVSIGTVKSRLFRGKKYLRELMEADQLLDEYVVLT